MILRAVLVVIALAALWLVVAGLPGGEVEPPGEDVAVREGSGSRAVAGDIDGDALSRVPLALDDDRLVVEVADQQGHPIADAAIVSCLTLSRALEDDQRSLLGRTDASGVFVLEGGPDRPPPQFMAIEAAGFVSGLLESAAWSEHYAVRLNTAVGLRARVVDSDGAPIPGAILTLSRSPMNEIPLVPSATSPGPVASEATYSEVADSDGYVGVLGLSPGEYAMSLSHRAHLWVDDGRHRTKQGALVVPRPLTEFTMRRLVGCYKRIEGCRVLARAGGAYPIVDYRGAGSMARNIMRERLGATDAATVIAITTEGMERALGVYRIDLFLEGEGWREFVWPFKRFSLDDPPDVVEVQSQPSPGGASGICLVEIRDSSARLLPTGAMRLESTSSREFSVRIENGVERRVPCGEYRLSTSDSFLEDVARSVLVRVVEGANPEVVLTAEVAHCRFDLRVPGNRPLVGLAGVQIEADDPSIDPSFESMWSRRDIMLPPGGYHIRIASFLYSRESARVYVERSGESPQVFTIELYPRGG